jgi:hypothetical protein
VVSFTPRPLYHRGKSHRYTLKRRLGEPQSLSERHEEVKILRPHQDTNSNPSVVQPVATRYTDCAIPVVAFKLDRYGSFAIFLNQLHAFRDMTVKQVKAASFQIHTCANTDFHTWLTAVSSGCVPSGRYCPRPLERWGRRFESHPGHEYTRITCSSLFCICVVLYVDRSFTIG